MTLDLATGIFLIIGVVGVQMINELVKVFFAKMRSADYVDKAACSKCQTASNVFDTAQGHKIDAIAKLVLAMAVKMGVDVKDIQGIM